MFCNFDSASAAVWLTHPPQFVVSDGAGIHKGLGNDG